MELSRQAWYWLYVAIVSLVGLIGFTLAIHLNIPIIALLVFVGSAAGVLMMTIIYRIA